MISAFTAYVVVSILLALGLGLSAATNFARIERLVEGMMQAGVPVSWLSLLAWIKTSAAIGLVVGIFVPIIGLAAALGVIVFFIGALVVHIRARAYSLWLVGTFLTLGISTLWLGLATYPSPSEVLLR